LLRGLGGGLRCLSGEGGRLRLLGLDGMFGGGLFGGGLLLMGLGAGHRLRVLLGRLLVWVLRLGHLACSWGIAALLNTRLCVPAVLPLSGSCRTRSETMTEHALFTHRTRAVLIS
jgi:hypothetical protein